MAFAAESLPPTKTRGWYIDVDTSADFLEGIDEVGMYEKPEPEYADLARLKDAPVLTIYLNEDYAPLKRYLGVRQRDLVRSASSPAYERYAVDVGVAMLVLHQERESRVKKGETVDESFLEIARQGAAQGAVSILPQFDVLAREAGLEE